LRRHLRVWAHTCWRRPNVATTQEMYKALWDARHELNDEEDSDNPCVSRLEHLFRKQVEAEVAWREGEVSDGVEVAFHSNRLIALRLILDLMDAGAI
jgi:hypothetical protein